MDLESLVKDESYFSGKAMSVLKEAVVVFNLAEGGIIMAEEFNDRKILGSFNNSELSGNNAIQSDHVTQSQQISKGEYEKAFDELNELIKGLSDEIVKEQAELFSETLKEALKAKDKSKGEKVIKFLVTTLGLVTPLVTIARLTGIPLPN
ncbi:hypothetical protein [Psychrobacillus sp. FSL H8-0487]|uniref:hypothetical protein n=1 Tax=Psychrobacillus sp. FSL H8-0487 TaxID=2921391 RepID=UPI0030FC03C1